jgi:REP-associated tyrosine transposase
MRTKGPHKAYALYAHLTWHTRWRDRTVRREDVLVVTGAVRRAAERHNVHVLAQAVLTEHVHVLVSYRPDTTLAAFVRDAKSESSRLVGENATWCRGYYAGSVCASHLAVTRTYIARQHSHHLHLIPPG